MEVQKNHKVILNLGLSLAFVILGILLFNIKSEKKILDIPSNQLIGFFAILVNSVLSLKWLYKLIKNNR
ncbi:MULTISPECIES: hypothetical protein [Flavobacterium]|uniref:Uncharacterized protein n=1 Tax=Flavobacterium hankyongi TaxID=1176532 RepID=A0ABP9A9T2_9FLAO|nr:hypothetical protein [Flavobacterium sp. N1846]